MPRPVDPPTPASLRKALTPQRIYAHGADSSPGVAIPAARPEELPATARPSEPLRRLEREGAAWLAMVERRVIVPVKWIIWGLTLLYWYTRQSLPGLPDELIFGTYVFSFLANLGFTWLAWVSGIAPRQARAYSLASLGCDLLFLSLVIYADSLQASPAFERDFYVFIVLMIMRGLVVLRSANENLVYGLLMTGLLLWAARLHLRSFAFLVQWEFALRLGLVWIVFSIGWYLLESLQRQQRQLLAMREQLVRSENLATLGEVSAGIAHEINNPIGIIGACADWLRTEVTSPPDARTEIETIRQEARRCKRIVQELLDYAAPEQSTEIARVNLAEFVDDLVGKMQRDFPSSPRLERSYPAKPVIVRADRHKLAQAIGNIVTNAAQHPPRTGECVIRLSLTLERREGQEMARLDIADRGPGIAPGDVQDIFKPFFSRRRGGTGLGLAISRRIFRAHHGELLCSSIPGEGTTMTILMPVLG